FYQDLAAHHMADKVLIATWSEFGRRPKENASGGTDHGAAAPLLLIGDPVHGGLFGEEPSLTSLDDTGNLKYAVDLRSVYQEILSGHLGADSGEILGSAFERVPFVKAPLAVCGADARAEGRSNRAPPCRHRRVSVFHHVTFR